MITSVLKSYLLEVRIYLRLVPGRTSRGAATLVEISRVQDHRRPEQVYDMLTVAGDANETEKELAPE